MIRTHTLIVLGLLLMPPATVLAYATPEEVLFPSAGFNTNMMPPSERQTGNVFDAQQEQTAARRQAEWQAAYDAQHPKSASSAAASSTSSKPTLEDVLSSLKDSIDSIKNGGDSRGAAPAQDEHMDTSMTIGSWEDPTRSSGQEEVLHSGAPLVQTGPGSWVAGLLIVAAIIGIVWRIKPATK